MRWERLAFLHWPCPAEVIAERLPPGLEVDTFDGSAWLGVVPFEMADTRLLSMPLLLGARRFLELNLRTYVRCGDRTGVWFFSLDAASRLAVRGARATFALPYFDARMEADGDVASGVEYCSERTHRGVATARFRGRYRATGPAAESVPGTLEHFLTERYSLFAQRGFGVRYALRGGLVRGDVEHAPWPLRPGEAELEECSMFELGGWTPPDPLCPPVVHCVDGIDVSAHRPVRV